MKPWTWAQRMGVIAGWDDRLQGAIAMLAAGRTARQCIVFGALLGQTVMVNWSDEQCNQFGQLLLMAASAYQQTPLNCVDEDVEAAAEALRELLVKYELLPATAGAEVTP